MESIRSILYFGGDTVASHLLTLGIWGAVSLAVVVVSDRIKAPRAEAWPVGEAPAPADPAQEWKDAKKAGCGLIC